MATVKAVLYRDRKRKCGGYSLVIQIIHKRSKRVIYTPYVLMDEEFDVDKQEVVYIENSKFTKKEIKEMNQYVVQQKEEIRKLILFVNSVIAGYGVEDIVQAYRRAQAKKGCLK